MDAGDWVTLAACLTFFFLLPVGIVAIQAVKNAPNGHIDLGSGTFIERTK